MYWIYDGYLWVTNTIPPRDKAPQLLLLLAMVGFLICALAIPDAFGESGVAFGIGYLLVTAVHTGLFLRANDPGVRRTMLRLGPINSCVAGLILIGGFVVFRRVLAIGPIVTRLAIAAAALATAAVGLDVTAEAQLGALAVMLFGGLWIESATRRPDATRRSSAA